MVEKGIKVKKVRKKKVKKSTSQVGGQSQTNYCPRFRITVLTSSIFSTTSNVIRSTLKEIFAYK
jgi:hypothetical protein